MFSLTDIFNRKSSFFREAFSYAAINAPKPFNNATSVDSQTHFRVREWAKTSQNGSMELE